jgi:hypothetical protein
MTIEITDPELRRVIEQAVANGSHDSPEAYIATAVAAFEADLDDFGPLKRLPPGELSRLLAEGEASGDCVDAEVAFARLDAKIAEAKRNREFK